MEYFKILGLCLFIYHGSYILNVSLSNSLSNIINELLNEIWFHSQNDRLVKMHHLKQIIKTLHVLWTDFLKLEMKNLLRPPRLILSV